MKSYIKDIMVDLETYDIAPTAKILSIGACLVNWEGEEPTDPFYVAIKLDGQADFNRTESQSTVQWWATQSEEARKVINHPEAVPFEKGMLLFRDYLGGIAGYKNIRMWGNGSDFDNVILVSAFASLDISPPWAFWNNRCFRTVSKELEHLMQGGPVARQGTHHDALDDAMHQARVLAKLASILRP